MAEVSVAAVWVEEVAAEEAVAEAAASTTQTVSRDGCESHWTA